MHQGETTGLVGIASLDLNFLIYKRNRLDELYTSSYAIRMVLK